MRATRRLPTLLLPVALVAPAAAQVKHHREIRYPPLPEFKIEQPRVVTLENGLTVFLIEDHELPLIRASARVRTGTYYEPADKVGLANLMATVQRTGGTKRMSGDEVDEFLAARAATIETGMGGDAGTASLDCLREDFDEVFRVFAEILREPRFAEDKLEVAKVQAKASIARRNDNPNGILFREFSRLIYGPQSPLARLEEYATIAAVTRQDLVEFHQRYYHPNNIFLGLVGDFDTEEMIAKVRRVLGDWPRGPEFELRQEPYRTEPNPGIYFVEKRDVTQASIAVGHLGTRVADDPDYYALQVMNEVLGGGFAGRLFSNVRSAKGLAYSVGGGVGAGYLHPGLFRVVMQTKSSTMAAGVEALREEIRGMLDHPPTEEELQRAKESILNSFVFNYDSKSEILFQQMTYAYYGLPSDFLERYRANIEKVRREDVIRVARKFIHPEQLTLLVLGNPDDFDRPLSRFGEVTVLDITIPAPPEQAPALERSRAALDAGRKILERAVAAIGGGQPEALRALRQDTTVTATAGGPSFSFSQSVTVAYPDKLHQVMRTPMGEQRVVFDGATLAATARGRTMPLGKEHQERIREDLRRDLFYVALRAAGGGVEAIAAGSGHVEGTPCDEIEITVEQSRSRLCVAADGRVLRQSFQGRHPLQGSPGTVEIFFGDYRDVDGHRVPFEQRLHFDGQEVLRLSVTGLEFDPPIAPDTFAVPAPAEAGAGGGG